MLVEASYDSASGIWTIVLDGAVIPSDVVHALEAMYESSDYSSDAPRLYDARAAHSSIRPEDLSRLARLPVSRESTSNARSAIAVSRDVSYGVARMYQSLAEDMPVDIKIFRDIEEARTWLLSAPKADDEIT